ncbi:MAG: PfkB family carbohydrate kinase [Planctomycetota bacterium]
MRAPSDSKPPVIIVGEVLVDCFADGHQVIGGAPFNVAWNLHGFGFDPLFISSVGSDDVGQQILAAMKRWGMRTQGLQIMDSQSSGRVHVEIIDGQPHYDIVHPVAFDFIDSDPAVAAAKDYLAGREAATLYHGSLAYRSRQTAATITTLKQTIEASVFFDINIRDPHFDATRMSEFMRAVTVLKCNWDEMNRLIGDAQVPDAVDDSIPDAADDSIPDASEDQARFQTAEATISKFGLDAIWLTAGSSGAHFITRGGGTQSLGTPHVARENLGDTVGAGDAFAAAAIAGQALGMSPKEILQWAVQHAAKVCTLRGATTEDRGFYASE